MHIAFKETTPFWSTQPVPKVFHTYTEAQIRFQRELGRSLMLTEGLNRVQLAKKLGLAIGALNWLMQGLVGDPGKHAHHTHRYSPAQKAAKLAEAKPLLEKGMKVMRVAHAIGVAPETLAIWLGKRTPRLKCKMTAEPSQAMDLPEPPPAVVPSSDEAARERMSHLRFPNAANWAGY